MPLRHVLYVLQIVQINANIRPEQCILFSFTQKLNFQSKIVKHKFFHYISSL